MKIGSLFSGIGGIDLAFEQAGFTIEFANEIDCDACKTYRYNFPGSNLIEGDIREINADDLPDVDVVVAGFPCQPFSVCGKREGFNDERGNLFFEIMGVVDAKMPSIVFLENVANLVEHDMGRTFLRIHNELASRNYVIRYNVADACNYGIPQHRTRTYIVAFRDECAANCYTFPQKSNETRHISDVINRKMRAPDELYLSEGTREYQALNRYIDDENQLYRFSDYGIQASKNGISFTLKANMGTWRNRIPYIKDAFGIRILTPDECMRIMGFPDTFCFPENVATRNAYKQCGNSVAVPLVLEIAKAIKSTIA